MNYKYEGIKDFEGYILECDIPLEKWEYGTQVNVNLYQSERLNPEDAKSVCDSLNSEYKENPRDAEKSASANCPRCTFPKKGKNQRIYCMCD